MLSSIIIVAPVCLGFDQQVGAQEIDKILERADQLLEEAKALYEDGKAKASAQPFIEAGFKLEEARIKYFVLQEIGSAEKQKVAGDRLRSVNQLGKLIHDGRVAVSGAPAPPPPPPPEKAIDASKIPAPKDPPPAPELNPGDVTKRIPIPEGAKLREAEKLVKELFKDPYAKKSQEERKGLPRVLLGQARKNQGDSAAAWVLYREAQDLASQSGDITTAIEAIDESARFFEVDAMSLKNAALTTASKSVKIPDECLALTDALFKQIDELVRIDQFDTAEKDSALAIQVARKSGNISMLSTANNRAKDVSEAKTLFQGFKSVLQTLAKTPDDPPANLEMGKFVCFVKGNWDLGLRFLAKGSDPVLKGLAEKDLALPNQPSELITLADGWWNLAEKEKSFLRKSQLLAHARSLYEIALSDSSGLVRTKIEKRLLESDSGDEPATNDLIGRWLFNEGKGLKANDLSGKGNLGALNGAVNWVQGVSGTAVNFDGATGYVSVGTAGLPAANAPLTIAWAQYMASTPKGDQVVISFADVSAGLALTAMLRGGKLTVAKWGMTSFVTTDWPSAYQWHYLAYTFDGKTHKFFVNGVLKDSSTVPPSQGIPNRFELGRWGGNPGEGAGKYFCGSLDDLRIYSRALNENEVRMLTKTRK